MEALKVKGKKETPQLWPPRPSLPFRNWLLPPAAVVVSNKHGPHSKTNPYLTWHKHVGPPCLPLPRHTYVSWPHMFLLHTPLSLSKYIYYIYFFLSSYDVDFDVSSTACIFILLYKSHTHNISAHLYSSNSFSPSFKFLCLFC